MGAPRATGAGGMCGPSSSATAARSRGARAACRTPRSTTACSTRSSSPRGAFGWASVLADIATRHRAGHKRLDRMRGRGFTVEAARPIEAEIDGDPIGVRRRLEIESTPSPCWCAMADQATRRTAPGPAARPAAYGGGTSMLQGGRLRPRLRRPRDGARLRRPREGPARSSMWTRGDHVRPRTSPATPRPARRPHRLAGADPAEVALHRRDRPVRRHLAAPPPSRRERSGRSSR